MDSFKRWIQSTTKYQKKTKQNVSSGNIVAIGNQGSGVDYYDIEINNKIYKNVPCPIPLWLTNQMANVQNLKSQVKNFASSRTYIGVQYDISTRTKTTFEREPLFAVGDNVEVTFEGGNQAIPKITLELSGKKYKELTIYYV